MKNGLIIDQCTVTLMRGCNLRCKHCYAKKTNYEESSIIEYEQLQKLIDFCDEASVKYVVFTGGEPTLYTQLSDILEYIQHRGYAMSVAISTNGIRLQDYGYCESLINKGVIYFDISLKGSNERECYEMVGADCFQPQMDAIHNLSQLSAEVTCSMVLTLDNIDSFTIAVANAFRNGARQFSFTFVIDNEESEEKGLIYLERHDPFILIEKFFSKIDELNRITNEWWIEYSLPLCAYSDEQLTKLHGKMALPCMIYKRNGITFDTDLNLIPCNMFFDRKMGRFTEDFSTYKELEEYVSHPVYKDTMDSLSKMPSESCFSCDNYVRCYGGCPVVWKNISFDTLQIFKQMKTSLLLSKD